MVVLECKAGSVLMALEGACRKRHVEMQTVRKGEVTWAAGGAEKFGQHLGTHTERFDSA